MQAREAAREVAGEVPAAPSLNEVALVGRVSAAAEERVLPSGDTLLSWRLIVDRPPPRKAAADVPRVSVDTVDCVAFAGGVQRTARSFEAGDVVRVEGALRRRFWRSPGGGPVSRTEVEVASAKRLARAAQVSR